jgi:hypothetical protein
MREVSAVYTAFCKEYKFVTDNSGLQRDKHKPYRSVKFNVILTYRRNFTAFKSQPRTFPEAILSEEHCINMSLIPNSYKS